jgi:hypothetical protein
VRRRERRVRHSTRALEPTSSTVPAAPENDHQNDDDDQKRRGVHHCLLFEAQRIGVPPREGEFHLRGERSGSVPGFTPCPQSNCLPRTPEGAGRSEPGRTHGERASAVNLSAVAGGLAPWSDRASPAESPAQLRPSLWSERVFLCAAAYGHSGRTTQMSRPRTYAAARRKASFSPPPILFSFPLHGRRVRVLHLEPVVRPAGPIPAAAGIRISGFGGLAALRTAGP